jgi:small subunit ribosomal protein S21
LPFLPNRDKLFECQSYAKKGVNTLPKVVLRSDESQEQLLRRFSREVIKSRVMTDIRRKRWFVSKSELNRIAKKKAARRTRKTQKEQQQGV